MVELVNFIARALVEKPDAVDVREVENDDSIVIELRVDPDDMGKVIGKQGRTAPFHPGNAVFRRIPHRRQIHEATGVDTAAFCSLEVSFIHLTALC